MRSRPGAIAPAAPSAMARSVLALALANSPVRPSRSPSCVGSCAMRPEVTERPADTHKGTCGGPKSGQHWNKGQNLGDLCRWRDYIRPPTGGTATLCFHLRLRPQFVALPAYAY